MNAEEFVRYWHPTKGGWYVGIFEGSREVKGQTLVKVRPLKKKLLSLEVPASSVQPTDLKRAKAVQNAGKENPQSGNGEVVCG